MPAAPAADKSASAEKPAAGGEAAAAPAGDADLTKMIADSDPKKGQADAQVCGACHNLKEGAGTLVGPDLYGVVDRDKGSVAGFDYSAGMKAKGGKWTYADLNEFITKPQAYVKGTKMGFAGEANPKKRAEIISYLRTLAKDPAPLAAGSKAEPAAAGKPAPAAAPAAPPAPAAAPPAPPATPAPAAAPPAPPAPSAAPPAPPPPPAATPAAPPAATPAPDAK